MAESKNITIFVTGTDTGVGKTLLTALWVRHLRNRGFKALATKPFCSGAWDDVDLLEAAQHKALFRNEICPFFFREPLAPLAAARRERRRIRITDALDHIRLLQMKSQFLLVEGAGGLMVPLGEGFVVADLIQALSCAVVVVAQNRLGTVNHTVLTVESLRTRGVERVLTVMMSPERPDRSCTTNILLIRRLETWLPVVSLPFLGPGASRIEALERNEKKAKKLLRVWTRLLTCAPLFDGTPAAGRRRGRRKFGKPVDSEPIGL